MADILVFRTARPGRRFTLLSGDREFVCEFKNGTEEIPNDPDHKILIDALLAHPLFFVEKR